ncbi:serine/threonine protein phosphatase 1 [Salipiger thiooxidans]|uniref:Serine/threonine protein phosphatase 1 n=1 Tax=Salipiger thiooxidans TaxID=282683 RepID=A0A1G7LMC4_9RHOB|nr:metallophosphoesterase family protein [Salipiger thiooxidans]SDF50536.1 serine/threonine protein phosphatase 1 [Salipiger thiooxidans]
MRPEEAFFAVGDIHGCDALLGRLLSKLEELAHPTAKLVMVGDYIDRGEQSADVLRRLRRMQADAGPNLMICLRGNHDQMLLDFLEDPQSFGMRWFRHGGLQTLASYGLPGVAATASDSAWSDARDRLRDRMEDGLEDWLRGLPTSWQTGNVFVCHAGADPARPIDAQRSRSLIWGHPDFDTVPRTDGIWVVHGHTITERARPKDGRIPVDTGAYATGRLTAALLETGKVQFFST